jgi:FkbM family methyltransferase
LVGWAGAVSRALGKMAALKPLDLRGNMLPRANVVRCDDGDFILFSTEDMISKSLYKTGQWERNILEVSKAFYKGVESPLVLDVGANLGAYAIPIARDIHAAGGTVYAYEPQRVVYYQLCGNVVLNRLDNCHAFNQAVGDVDGEIEIPDINYQANGNVGAFSFRKEYREKHGIESAMSVRGSHVPIVKLDSIKVPKAPSLIKIDVEGFELNVLRGGAGLLERHHFPPFLFEAWHFDWFKDERESLLAFVKGMGYELDAINVTNFVAQHPRHDVRVDFVKEKGGVTRLVRAR